jgi:hypothetical protein
METEHRSDKADIVRIIAKTVMNSKLFLNVAVSPQRIVSGVQTERCYTVLNFQEKQDRLPV